MYEVAGDHGLALHDSYCVHMHGDRDMDFYMHEVQYSGYIACDALDKLGSLMCSVAQDWHQ